MEPKTILIALLILIAIAYHVFWYVTEKGRANRQDGPLTPKGAALGAAFVANFFDTLGIGSYATTTSMSKLWKLMPDEKIPGTLNVGYVMATVVQAVIFMTIIEVDFMTLVSIIGAAVIVGVLVSLLQAVTSIQEPTLSFAPKLIAVGAVIIVGAPWMIRQLMQFTVFFINKIPEMTK